MRSSFEARTAPAQSPVPPIPSAQKSHHQHSRHRRQRSSSPKLKNTTSSHRKTLKNRANSRIWLCAANAEVSFPSSSLSLLLSALYRHRIEKLWAFTPLSTSTAAHIQMSRSRQHFAVTMMTLFFSIRVKLAVSQSPQTADDRHTPNPTKLETSSKASPIYFFTLFPLSISLPRWKKAEKKTVSMTLRAYTGFYSTLRYFTTRSALREAASASRETN